MPWEGGFEYLPHIPCNANTLEQCPGLLSYLTQPLPPGLWGFRLSFLLHSLTPNKEQHLSACLSVPVLPPLAGALGHFSVFPFLSLLPLSPPYLQDLGTAVWGSGNELTLTSGQLVFRIFDYFPGGPARLQAVSHQGTGLPWHLCALKWSPMERKTGC